MYIKISAFIFLIFLYRYKNKLNEILYYMFKNFEQVNNFLPTFKIKLKKKKTE